MTNKIYWIDEKHETCPSGPVLDRIQTSCDAEIIIVIAEQGSAHHFQAGPKKLGEEILIALDYWLHNLQPPEGSNKDLLTEFGSTWATILRSKNPSWPLIGITSENIDRIPDIEKSQFLNLFARDKVFDGDHDRELRSIMTGYPQVFSLWESGEGEEPEESGLGLSPKKNIAVENILSIFAVPQDLCEYFKIVLPEFSSQSWDKGTSHELSRWIIKTFLRRPGFLLGNLEVATLLGVNIEGFKKIEPHLAEVKYTGVFASDDNPKWWAESIRACIVSLLGSEVIGPLRQHREALMKAIGAEGNELFSRAYGREGEEVIPDCVAFIDEQRDDEERVQTLTEDTEPDPMEHPPLGFDARRIWSGVSKF